jgi:hypothetical protein
MRLVSLGSLGKSWAKSGQSLGKDLGGRRKQYWRFSKAEDLAATTATTAIEQNAQTLPRQSYRF